MSLFGDDELPPVTARESQLDFWNQVAFERVQAQFKSGSMHHALLLLGPGGIGRETFAQELAQWVLCQNHSQLDSACGSCKSCQLFVAETHPDYHLLAVEDEKTQISVNQVRVLIESMQESAHQSGWKLANISDVAALNQNSYNALLKTLEEPQPQTLLILQAEQLQQVPATIRSRSQLVALSVNEQATIEAWLAERKGGMTEELKLALSLFPQAPYKAEDFANNGDAVKCGDFILDISCLMQGNESPLALAEKWLPDIEDCCLWMLLMMRDLLLLQQANDKSCISLQGQTEALTNIVNILNNQRLMQLNEKIVELRSLLIKKSPVNLSSSWQALLIYCSQLAQKTAKSA